MGVMSYIDGSKIGQILCPCHDLFLLHTFNGNLPQRKGNMHSRPLQNGSSQQRGPKLPMPYWDPRDEFIRNTCNKLLDVMNTDMDNLY